MKIVVTASGSSEDSQVDPRFGRAAAFMVYDTEQKSWEVYNNEQNFEAAQGAGIQSAQNIRQTGAEVLITGNVGPKAFKVLNANNVKVYSAAQMSVNQAVEAYLGGELAELKSANVNGHWM